MTENAGYEIRNHPHLTHSEAHMIGDEGAVKNTAPEKRIRTTSLQSLPFHRAAHYGKYLVD